MLASLAPTAHAYTLEARLLAAIVDSESRTERAELLNALDYLSAHLGHVAAEPLTTAIRYAEDVLDWLDRGGIRLILAVDGQGESAGDLPSGPPEGSETAQIL